MIKLESHGIKCKRALRELNGSAANLGETKLLENAWHLLKLVCLTEINMLLKRNKTAVAEKWSVLRMFDEAQ